MKLTAPLSLFILLFLATTSFAQTKVKVYRTKEGKLFNVTQKDSIWDLGFLITTTDKTIIGDTIFYDTEILPKENEFVKKYRNKPLPSFALKTLDGKELNSEFLKGKAVMINFWSTTCAPCVLEMPQLNKLKKKYKDVVFLAPAPENATTVKKFLLKHKFDFIILPQAEKLFEEWGIDSYPKNFFVDQNGIIREIREGTPMLNERDKNGKLQVAVDLSYSPILNDLTRNK
jgi:thiol-disulfide isomerase/thioredoxin